MGTVFNRVSMFLSGLSNFQLNTTLAVKGLHIQESMKMLLSVMSTHPRPKRNHSQRVFVPQGLIVNQHFYQEVVLERF